MYYNIYRTRAEKRILPRGAPGKIVFYFYYAYDEKYLPPTLRGKIMLAKDANIY